MGLPRLSFRPQSVLAVRSNINLISKAGDLANGYVDDVYTLTDKGSLLIVHRTFVVTNIWKPRYIKSNRCDRCEATTDLEFAQFDSIALIV
jgi:hypothetical protein